MICVVASSGSKRFTALSKLGFQPRDVLQRPSSDQLQKVEPKLGILKKAEVDHSAMQPRRQAG
jgi:hypothetical protein